MSLWFAIYRLDKNSFFLHGAEPTGAVVVTAVGSMAAPVDWTGVPE